MKRTIICAMALMGLSGVFMTAQAADTAEIGMHHTVANGYYINQSGELRTWGGEKTILSDVVDVSSGEGNLTTGVVLEDGSLYVWGRNEDGQLGLGDTRDRETPAKVPGLDNVVSVSMGRGFTSAAVTSDGDVYIWGRVYQGDDAAYNPIIKSILKPQKVRGIEHAVSVSVGDQAFVVLCSDGSVYSWGMDDGGSNGYGERRNSAVPVKLSLPPIRAVSRGISMAAAVTTDGKLYTWGTNEDGILGREIADGAIDCKPDLVDIEPIRSVCIGRWFYISALAESGAVYQWGSTTRDFREQGPETNSRSPKILHEQIGFVQVVLGEGKSAGVTEDGKLYTWGWNGNGELGNSSGDYHCDYPTLAKTDAKVPGILPEGTLKNLSVKQRSYVEGLFTDINENAWYGINQTGSIAKAYEYAFVEGTGGQKFSPDQTLQISEAIRLVCSLQDRYANGSGYFPKALPWYRPYVHHAVTTGIFRPGDFISYSANATRAQMAYLFAHALPESEMTAINHDVSISDVTDRTCYSQEIHTLYAAGILAGTDQTGKFEPDRTITRAEATAIFLRLALPENRVKKIG